MLHKAIRCAAALVVLAIASGCTTAPTKPLPPQLAAIAPTAFVVLADGAVGLAVSKGVKPDDIASIAYQLDQFASGQNVTVQALTTEIMHLEQQANLNAVQIAAITQLRAAFDTIILGYITNGVIDGTAKTTLHEILQNLISAAVLLGAPAPGPTTPGTPSTADSTAPIFGPPAPDAKQQSSTMRALESPALVGGATSTVIVASLQAFKHLTVSAPTAAAITVLATFLAQLLYSM